MKFTSISVGICSKIAVHISKIRAANEQEDNGADIGESKQRILLPLEAKGKWVAAVLGRSPYVRVSQ